jgi:hypothetical protein
METNRTSEPEGEDERFRSAAARAGRWRWRRIWTESAAVVSFGPLLLFLFFFSLSVLFCFFVF